MPKMGRRALFCYNKARNKERKKGDALRKRFRNFRIRPAMKSQGVKENRK